VSGEPDSEESSEKLSPEHMAKLNQSVDSLRESVDNLAIMLGKLIAKMEERFYYRLILEETEKQVRENERRKRDRKQFWGKPRGR